MNALRPLLSCGLLILGMSCAREQKAPPAEEKTAIAAAPLNPAPTVHDFAVYASNSVELNQQAVVAGGDVGAKNASAGPFLFGTTEVSVLQLAQINTTRNLLGDAVLLQAGAVVGDVQTNHLTDQGSTHGTVTPFVTMPALPAASPVSPGTANLTVAAGATQVLAANARFAVVTLGLTSKLRLTGGVYQFSQLQMGQQSRIEALAACEIRISGRLGSGNQPFIGAAPGVTLSAKDIRVEVSGSNGGTGTPIATPSAVQFGQQASIRAVVLAPNGTIRLDQSATATGALVGRDVLAGQGAHVTFEDGFGAPACPVSCDDANPCSADACSNGACTHTPLANGTACSDGNACTQTDTCQAGSCVGSNPVTCTAQDQCHLVGTCAPATGQCSNPAKVDGTACTDGNACSQSDTCQAGTCTGSNPVTCTAQDQCHTAGTCNSANGTCSNPAKVDGTACSDGNACTQSDTCQAGTCTGANPVTCVAADQCHVAGSCDPSSGQCSNPAAPNGTLCSDGNACTLVDACTSGSCVGTNPVVCSAQDQCRVAGTCDPSNGTCSNPAKADGTACSDGNACTQSDTCQGGSCAGSNPITCSAQDQCHVAGTCAPATGQCSNPAKADGTACSDGNACTQSDTCQTGTCNGANPVTCVALDQCHDAGTCDTSTGNCSNPNKANGSACDDGTACTSGETCQNGACGSPSSTIQCTAQDQCHDVGTCNASTGVCSNPSKADGTSCSDGNACTQVDSCQAGGCVGTNPVTCTAQDQCHVAGTCEASTGQCSNPAQADGTGCNDGNACTAGDACQAGSCVGPTSVTCTALDQCHLAGTCDPSSGCSNPTKTDGSACDDSNGCTQSDTCQAGTCTGSNPVNCMASDACHVAGTCNPQTGACSTPNAPNGTACNDGNICTQTDACQAGSCIGSNPVQCAPQGQCHVAGTCDPVSGVCSNPVAANGTSCNQGAPCVTGETCQGGTCQGGSPASIDDGNPCTLDTCDSQHGVVHHACSPVDRTVSTTLVDATSFLYSGADPIQTGVAQGTIVATTLAVIKGRVLQRDGSVLPGVTVTVVNHPEFGGTLTQGDGGFDLAVNGGPPLRIRYSLGGYLPSERSVSAPWQNYVRVPDVVLIRVDAEVTTIDVSGSSNMQVARGSVSADTRGSRQATVLIPANTQAMMTLPDQSSTVLGTIHVRATEYTVGSNGPNAMPAELPPTSGYTYAVELSADEGLAAGATQVVFSQLLPIYLENFLGFPIGLTVPSGFYDRGKGAWVPSDNGRVIKILSITGGTADIDVNGDGSADAGATLLAMGITDQERQQLAVLYSPGQSLWRVPISHFTAWDSNLAVGPPNNSAPPQGKPFFFVNLPKKCPKVIGSLIDCQDQALGEELSLVGTPYTLFYNSDAQLGRKDAYTVQIPLSGALVGTVKRIDLEIRVAGRFFAQSFPAAANQATTFTWDGRDAYGRLLQGSQPISVRVGNVYDGVYVPAPRFGYNGNGIPITANTNTTVPEITLWSAWDGSVGPWDSKPVGLGGWTLSVHHYYDVVGRVLHLGDGTIRNVASLPNIIRVWREMASKGSPAMEVRQPRLPSIRP